VLAQGPAKPSSARVSPKSLSLLELSGT
jgi:hypothetical protein